MHVLQVVTTVDALEVARRLAHALVERRVAACCQIVGPIESIYRWKDAIETAQEWQLVIKTRSSQWDALQAIVRELHPYETPELLATEVALGHSAYLDWVRDTTGPIISAETYDI
ncbi:MAG: divalent-cation tolerance protein CutA [Pirellulales bacterium]